MKPRAAVLATAEAPKAESAPSIAATCVRALLDRAGLSRHRHSAQVAELLNLSYHQAHRRMNGMVTWSLEELQVIASHYGESLEELISERKSATYETAVLVVGSLRVTCRLWPGQLQANHPRGDLIAIKEGSTWSVVVAGDAPTTQGYTVRRLVIDQKPERPRRLAILDDDFAVARGMAEGLIAQGFEAVAFSSEDRLEAALLSESFDAYLIDWVLQNGTADALVARLRSLNATCPIALLTGKAGTKDVDEKALVAAIEQYDLMFLQKPVPASIAASQFNAAFANR